MKKYHYKVFGINIESEVELSELIENTNCYPDVFIKTGKIPINISKSTSKGALYQITKNDFVLHIESICSYRAQFGKIITIQPVKDVSISDIKVFLYGSVMAAIIHQRGMHPVHGSAVIFQNQATIFSGISSAGKSSLAYALTNSGHRILSDDISTLSDSNNGKVMVYPGIPYLKLWHDVIELFNHHDELNRVRESISKYYLSIKDHFCYEPIEVRRLVIIHPTNSKTFQFNKVTGARKFELLKSNTYRYNYLIGMDKLMSHFEYISIISKYIDVFLLERPMSPLLVKELALFVTDKIKE